MNQIKILFIAFLVLINQAAVAKGPATETEIRTAIQYQISQRHPNVPQGFWEGLGEGAIPVIESMYLKSVSIHEKGFLIDGLSHFSSLASGSFLEIQVADALHDILRKKLLGAVIDVEGERSFDFVEPYLKDSDPHVRLNVAIRLKSFTQNEKIQRRLTEFSAKEKLQWVLSEFNKAPAGDGQQSLRKRKSL